MNVEKMAAMAAERLQGLGYDVAAADCILAVEREWAYVRAFCAVEQADDELGEICAELAAATVLRERALLSADKSVKSIAMGDVDVSYAESEAATESELAEGMYRRGIVRLAAKRGIRW